MKVVFWHISLVFLVAKLCNGITLEVLGGNIKDLIYYAKVEIGSFKGKPGFNTYYLAIDTASPVTWIQCEKCKEAKHHCFPQIEPPFPNSMSRSYIPLKVEGDTCVVGDKPKEEEMCIKSMVYNGNESTSLELAYENFSSSNTSHDIRRILFGCGIDQLGFDELIYPTIMAGILGLNKNNFSLQVQLDNTPVGLEYSYCFPMVTVDGGPTTYLRFGQDVPPKTMDFQSTPLLPGEDDAYYVNMTDIAVNGHHLGINPSVFRIEQGGVIVDSGSSVSQLVTVAFDALKQHLVRLFSSNPNYRPRSESTTLNVPLCYDIASDRGRYEDLPTITFILQDANLVIAPQQAFLIDNQYFCLMIKPDDTFSVIGAFQQINHRLVFDNANSKLWLKPENCANDHYS